MGAFPLSEIMKFELTDKRICMLSYSFLRRGRRDVAISDGYVVSYN